MGTDIHAFVEYRKKDESNEKNSWKSFSSDDLVLERDYTMFHILSGVKGDAPKSFKAKGKIPLEDLSDWVRDKRIFLVDDESEGYEYDCTIEDAIRFKEEFGCRIHYVNNIPIWVDDPDSHTDTWLSYVEYEQAMQYYEDYVKEPPQIGYLATLAVMKTYHDAGYETRLVIWFDN